MICLTGDIHHASLRTNDQKYIKPGDSEINISRRFLGLLEKHGVKATFYVTGKSFKEEWNGLKPIAASPLVEIGGHTYNGIPLGALSRLRCRLIGRVPPSHSPTYGSRFSQERDIQKTIDAVEERTGRKIVSWRSHGYIHDKYTYSILVQKGIRLISDEISSSKTSPEKTKEGLISHPINTIPDHDHLYHAHRDEEFVKKAKAAGYGTDAFGCDSYSAERWAGLVRERIIAIEERGGLVTILMHPLCMYLADGFKAAEELLKFISGYKTIWAREITEACFSGQKML